MPQIGQFIRTPSGYSGRVRTLSLGTQPPKVPKSQPVANIAPSGEDAD